MGGVVHGVVTPIPDPERSRSGWFKPRGVGNKMKKPVEREGQLTGCADTEPVSPEDDTRMGHRALNPRGQCHYSALVWTGHECPVRTPYCAIPPAPPVKHQ